MARMKFTIGMGRERIKQSRFDGHFASLMDVSTKLGLRDQSILEHFHQMRHQVRDDA